MNSTPESRKNIIEIKLMPDYECWPLWWYRNTDKIGEVDPYSLALSPQTIKLLEEWAKMYDGFIDMEEPNRALNISEETFKKFEELGLVLWQKLTEELSDRYKIVYSSQKYNKVVETLEDYRDYYV